MTAKMGKICVLVCFVLALSAGLCLAQDDIKKHAKCTYCGMDRAMFAHSRMLLAYDDGTTVGTCSLHCAAVDLALNIDKSLKSIEAGDYKAKNLVNAEEAFWVLGGSKPGVMTKRAKWAFGKKADAETFIKESGGKLATFEDAVSASYEDMYADTKMIREKRKMMQMKHE